MHDQKEESDNRNGQLNVEARMDYHNNAHGRGAGDAFPGRGSGESPEEYCARVVTAKLENGELMMLDPEGNPRWRL